MRGDIEQWVAETIHTALLETNTAIPAVVEEWNSQDDTVSVVLSFKRQIGLKSEIFGELIDEQQTTDILQDVPCYRLRNTKYAETMPIEPGDRCMLLFQQRNINCWWSKGHECNPVNYHDTRKHHLSDAVAVFGLYPQMDFIPEINLEWWEKRTIDGLTRSAIKEDKGLWLMDMLSHLRLSREGFEVWVNNVGLLETLITGFTATAEGFTADGVGFGALATETVLTNRGVYAATAAADAAAAALCFEVVGLLEQIKGSVEIPEYEVSDMPEPAEPPPGCEC